MQKRVLIYLRIKSKVATKDRCDLKPMDANIDTIHDRGERTKLRGGIKDTVPKSRRSSPSLTEFGSSTPTGRAVRGIAAAGSAEEALEPMAWQWMTGCSTARSKSNWSHLTGVGVVIVITGRAHRGSGGVRKRITINRGEAGEDGPDFSVSAEPEELVLKGPKGPEEVQGARMDADVRRLRRSSTREESLVTVSKALNKMEDQVDVVAVATKCPLGFGVAVGVGAAMLGVISRIEACWWSKWCRRYTTAPSDEYAGVKGALSTLADGLVAMNPKQFFKGGGILEFGEQEDLVPFDYIRGGGFKACPEFAEVGDSQVRRWQRGLRDEDAW
ncbi:hypothetical protein BC829DRAFT_412980 [Chytridium lagenaria]|nr:hypothetical protein BC829DRAFT_412980 [Chytridium lagenaria]